MYPYIHLIWIENPFGIIVGSEGPISKVCFKVESQEAGSPQKFGAIAKFKIFVQMIFELWNRSGEYLKNFGLKISLIF